MLGRVTGGESQRFRTIQLSPLVTKAHYDIIVRLNVTFVGPSNLCGSLSLVGLTPAGRLRRESGDGGVQGG